MEEYYMEVYFGDYCPKCKHEKLKENEYPCSECLEYAVNLNTRKPVRFEETENKK